MTRLTPITSQHPVWARLMDAAKNAGLNGTSECLTLMDENDAVDVGAVPIAAVEKRIAQLALDAANQAQADAVAAGDPAAMAAAEAAQDAAFTALREVAV